MVDIETIHEDLLEVKRQLALIRTVLSNEGKLTPWAKKALAKARAESEEDYTSLDAL